MPNFEAVCFDFWWTLVTDRAPGGGRHEYRVEAFCKALTNGGRAPQKAAVDQIMRREWARYNRIHLTELRTPSNRERIDWMAAELGFDSPTGAAWDLLDQALEESLFVAPPRLLEGIGELLHVLALEVRLALISDTSYSGGMTIRRLLAQAGVLQLFDVQTFSGELGRAKPHAEVFLHTLGQLDVEPGQAVHIGDREATDIVGAKGVGMSAILFLGATPEKLRQWPQETEADHVAYTVTDLVELLLRG